MKSYLVSEGLAIPKTHDVGKLVELAAAKHAEFSRLQQIADAITPLATEFRYPMDDEAPMPTAQQTHDALAAARRIYEFVLSVLPAETHPV